MFGTVKEVLQISLGSFLMGTQPKSNFFPVARVAGSKLSDDSDVSMSPLPSVVTNSLLDQGTGGTAC